MFTLALRSVRQRPGRLLATLLSAFLGAAIVMTFGSLQDTAGAPGVDDVSAETLRVSSNVVGGYGALLVFFAVASALTVNVRQRSAEITLLRNTGATPAQIKRMVVGEAVLVGLAAALLAIGPAMLGGRVLLGLFQDSGQVADRVDFAFGPVALGMGFAVTLLASVGAAFLAVRRATKAAGARAGRGRIKKAAGIAALVGGTGAIASTFTMKASAPALMAAPAYGAILLSVGFAIFSPALLRGLLKVFERPITALAGASGYLTVHTMRHRAAQLSGLLMPLVLFTGTATAALYMQAVQTDAIRASGLTRSVEDKNVETVNLVVVGIIVVFACVMIINTLYAETSYRRAEFGRQRLAGATPGQVLRTVGLEGVVLTVTGVFFGTAAGLTGLLAFTAVRTDSVLPEPGPGVWLLVVAAATASTLLTGLSTARRALRTPAVAAASATA
ncbi:ABC transporter permease [Streptomyces sp. SID3212]|uniref:FtsX-like permease family protein n=1 Tax=Streptomyces sp. SID3212 TaxID=2690259 RepID=UPI00136F4AD4|nr:ABC transporter permease [Streptomyces sp. SID3212]MYV51275.1 FtsX-like permease family protein [Streptomyces sp. SID3212]